MDMHENTDNYDLTPQSIKVAIGGKPYILREATASAAKSYRNAGLRGVQMEGKRIVGMDGLADTDPVLVAGCLFELYDVNGTLQERPVILQTVLSWPDRVVSDLARRIKSISPSLEDKDDPKERQPTTIPSST